MPYITSYWWWKWGASKKIDGDIVCACTKVQEVHKRTDGKVAIPIEHSKNIYGCILDVTRPYFLFI